ncbi:MAG: histidine triad nucleotide-binding protein [Paraclostridium sordellii]|uniref:histidine triad nucleotide-binding protein n=1 Tax=Paraclostridium sordellii TaxID=1505 RepID=UPI0005EA2F4E|nr:histidine triad nucleotide-binding protein [Paeniclostridium sordellii]MCQ4697765.1 histidine triad nucleotide-binding protein [Paeniclostridium sordellii]MDU6482239.1 histidine triad nucleotide-binding protein [Paeniclostridium sordellii]MVO74601.1 HIT domain-containing protein [Paeniclostridium sordellii]CEN82685.1 histidine triad (HIT) protein [[Clostridium] sordellii] [Paeniclostridium sordellii]CEO07131.1 histidine triad (HIT) protein [[Clostridium] sordellii] [Paeniclostridium sordell
MSCIFCKIINGEIPSSKVYEDDKVLAFNDINPVAPLHVLVIPKKHYESIIDIDEKDMDIIAHIHNVINKIVKEKGYDKTGFRIINNCGADGCQEVKHIHYHVLAGKKLDWYDAEK